jgi:hypothetical protein
MRKSQLSAALLQHVDPEQQAPLLDRVGITGLNQGSRLLGLLAVASSWSEKPYGVRRWLSGVSGSGVGGFVVTGGLLCSCLWVLCWRWCPNPTWNVSRIDPSAPFPQTPSNLTRSQ